MNYFNQKLLLLRTVRHLRAGQILSRSRYVIRRSYWTATRRQIPKLSAPDLQMKEPLYAGLAFMGLKWSFENEIGASIEQAEALARREFCFLNRRVAFRSGIGWNDPNLSQLWRYHLHYFGYVQDLLIWAARGNRDASYGAFRSIACSWMNNNCFIRGDGWHPYTISIRIVNWLHAISGFAEQLRSDAEFRVRMQQSLRGQARILSRDLETDVRGNHLLANLRALVIAGLSGEDPEATGWLRKSLALFERELAEQVLPDGGHFERSPGYHIIVLQQCLELALALRHRNGSAPLWLDNTLERMLQYLAGIMPPDGSLPLLKDTTRDTIPPLDLLSAGALYLNDPRFKRSEVFGIYPMLLFGAEGWNQFCRWPSYTGSEPSREFVNSRHAVLRDDSVGDHLIFDVGKPCPDYLPAHAHADLLSYELQVGGQRIVVDSGVYEYTAGPWRDYFRSTRAHNTVEISDENQSEVWSSFRVARRAHPKDVLCQLRERSAIVQGSHDGYMRLPTPVTHRRTFWWKADSFWIVADELLGSGPARAASHVHFHPDVSLSRIGDRIWQLTETRCPLWIVVFGAQKVLTVHGQMTPARQGWYSERFGSLVANTVLSLYRESALPFCCGYVIFKGNPGTIGFLTENEATRIVITQGDLVSAMRLGRDGIHDLE